MNTAFIYRALAALLFLAPFVSMAFGATSKPNIIIVLTDDQGYGDIGALGNTMIHTPNLDKLAGESIRLTNFHVDSVCAPTRAALMTGRYSSRAGVWRTFGGRSLAAQDETMMPKLLADMGYATGMFGKWHLGDNYPFRPEDKGFQQVVRHGGGGVGQTPDYWGNNYFNDTYWVNGVPTKFKGYCTDVWFDQALQFIEKNRDHPFFAYIATNAPHWPYQVDEKYSKPYADKGVPSPMAEFYGMIEKIDQNMGRLDARLTELGLRENTVVIFMTDNGTSAGVPYPPGSKVPEGAWPGFSAGMRGMKGSEYEGGHRVPFFIRWPAGKLGPARDVSTLAAHIDVLPTLAQMAGVNVPAVLDIDGKSLMSLLRGEKGWPERTLVVQNDIWSDIPERWRTSAVMTQRWRLINGKELYDIQVDPGQKHDVAGDHPEVVAALRKAYNVWWDHTDDRFGDHVTIPIGEKENPVRLTAHEWPGINSKTGVGVWDQSGLKRNPVANSYWEINVTEPGAYEVELYQWDKPSKKILDATTARVQIGSVTAKANVPDDAKSVVLRLELPKGRARMQTWLRAADGTERGAFYAYIKRVY